MSTLFMSYALGLVAVAWLCVQRFNAAAPVRSYTTADQYYLGIVLYTAVGALVYFYLSKLVRFASPLEQSAPLVALALQMLALRLPLASHADAWIRDALQKAIGYPAEGQRLAAWLASALHTPDPAVWNEVKSVLMRRCYNPDDDWLEAAHPTRELWHRLATLFHQVRGWENDRRYARFVHGSREQFDVLRQRFDQLSLKIVRVLQSIERLGEVWEDVEQATAGQLSRPEAPGTRARCGERVKLVVGDMLADLREDLAFLNQNLCLFVARGILSECRTTHQRERQLAALGFAPQARETSTAKVLGRALAVYVLVFMVLLAAPILMQQPTVEQLAMQATRVAMIALVQIAAVAVAIIPTQLYGFAREDLHGRTPWRFVIVAGVAAAALAAVVQLPFLDALGRSFRTTAPWLVVPFATAACLAFLVQESRWSQVESETRRRLLDVLVVLVTVGAAISLARLLIETYGLRGGSNGNGAWWTTPAIILLIGIGIGSIVPSACRLPLRRAVQRTPGSDASPRSALAPASATTP